MNNFLKFSRRFIFKTGAVDIAAFDTMVEAAAKAPRRFGLAPKSSEFFSSEAVSFIQLLFYGTNKN